MQLREGASSEWQKFIEYTRNANPLDYGKIGQNVKIKLTKFPTDDSLIDYYENVFSKYMFNSSKYSVTSQKDRKKWHQMDKYLLIWCVAKLLQVKQRVNLVPDDEDWDMISKVLQVDSQLIKLKWISLLHSNLRIHQWTREEDQILKDIAEQFYDKNNWTELTIKFNSLSRTQRYPKQIRERWKNVLNPTIQKCLWDSKEKLNLIQLVYKYGKRWSLIQHHIKGRSENQIKNQYNGITRSLKKEKISNEEEKELLLHIIQNPNQPIQNLIDDFLLKLMAKQEQLKLGTTNREEIKIEVNNNLRIQEQTQPFEKAHETPTIVQFQSPSTLQSQNFPQYNNVYQNSPFQLHHYNSLAQQPLTIYQPYQYVQQYNQYKPNFYSPNYAHMRFPYYM
ncbi:unnamed protein product (macronuclear) [Paramecium tetraurelia]|uniref:Uncharacterized protein n=1 Tax=Paramecium tetraurelia TaxID=5888 RepID=A0D7P2_PARTE|nr:uncharacterized protein GSPATT00014026001 [Paramecium tetraurelia]CAK79059.1 unnamed protein product [Paramecium tetraurelia]|eukprot:XP_001446456.1 hypothetical protein (macronuclear) [Paramecium tetraurelia strain d4-2]